MRKQLIIAIFTGLVLLIGCSGKANKSAQGYWESANALYEVENFKGAITEYKNIINFYPEDSLTIRANFTIAEITKNNLKDYKTAINMYKKISKLYPDSPKTPNAMFMIGYIYANELKNDVQAKKSYEDFITQYPNHVLVPSAKWEIENLGKSLEEIQKITTDEVKE